MLHYVKLLESIRPSILVVTGPSGTGKTMQACKVGQAMIQQGKYSRIILTRPAISAANEQHGFLPGTLDKKMAPWVRPSLEYLENSKKVEYCPLGFMRGRTFERSWIIADEMQNSTRQQMLMLLTRIGYGSKMIIIGDTDQTDLPIGFSSGLSHLVSKIEGETHDEIRHIKLDDVKRHPVISDILKMYD
jgi:phosphate starvation-inducible PhoH-like protein